MLTPSGFGFSAEFQGDDPAYDDFDQYLQEEFGQRQPGWEPRFGKATFFNPDVNRYDYMYLLHGNVPEATSHEDAEQKVQRLLDELSHRLRSRAAEAKKAIRKPRVRVWRWP